MNTVPLRDYVIISKEEQSKTTPSGLITVVGGNHPHTIGTVLAVGAGKVSVDGTVIAPAVKVNDKVLFNKNAAAEIKADEQDVFLIREDGIMCVVG